MAKLETYARTYAKYGYNLLNHILLRLKPVFCTDTPQDPDSPMANLMLSVMGAFVEFERALIKERQREGIAQAIKRGAFKGRKKSLSQAEVAE